MNGHEWLKASAAAPGAGRGDGRAEGRLASRGHQADAREGSVRLRDELRGLQMRCTCNSISCKCLPTFFKSFSFSLFLLFYFLFLLPTLLLKPCQIWTNFIAKGRQTGKLIKFATFLSVESQVPPTKQPRLTSQEAGSVVFFHQEGICRRT